MKRSLIGLNLFHPQYYDHGVGYLVDRSKTQVKPNGMVWGEKMSWLAGDHVFQQEGGSAPQISGGKLVNGDALQATGGILTIKFTTQPTRWRLLAPGEVSTAKTFTQQAHDSWANAGIVRSMDWLCSNGINGVINSVKETTDFKTEDHPRWGEGTSGAPLLPLVRYCARENKDYWHNVPIQSSDQCIRDQATMIWQEIKDTTSDCFVQLSNEVWNSQFPQYKYAQARGGEKWDAQRSLFIAREFRKVMGARVKPVLGLGPGQFRNDAVIAALGGAMSEFYGVAIAPYFGSSLPASTVYASWTPQQFAQHVYDSVVRFGTSASNTTKWITDLIKQVKPYGCRVLAYEMGEDLGQGTIAVTAKSSAQLLRLVGDAIELWFDKWFAMGGGEACYFNAIDDWGDSGMWPLEDRPAQRGPKWAGWNSSAVKYQRDVGSPPTPTPTPTPTPPPSQETLLQVWNSGPPSVIAQPTTDELELVWSRPSPIQDVHARLVRK